MKKYKNILNFSQKRLTIKTLHLFFFMFSMLGLQTMVASSSQSFAQVDYVKEMARRSISQKLEEVLSSANGLKDADPIKTTGVNNNTGYYQNTNNNDGIIYWFDVYRESTYTYGSIRKKYTELGAEKSQLGFPTSDIRTSVKSGADSNIAVYAAFENGQIIQHAGHPPYAVVGIIFRKYGNMGGHSSVLGFPMSRWQSFLGRKNQYFQMFQGGAFWGDGLGNAWVMHGPILKKWDKAKHGLPLEDLKGNSVLNMQSQKFEKGVLVHSAKTGAWFVQGDFLQKWYALGGGGVNTTTGLPISDEVGGALYVAQDFEKGLMIFANGEAKFLPDNSEKNKSDNNKTRQTIRLPGKH